MTNNDRLPPEFPAHLIPKIVSKVRLGYEENHPYHDPSIGHGPVSYGTHVHETVCFRLMELDEFPGVDTQKKSGSTEIRFGVFTLRPYKLGHSEEDDVWSSYPNNIKSVALKQMAYHNIAPPLPGMDLDYPAEYTDFVVGHFGAFDEEHSEGCRAIYLCVPRYVQEKFGGWMDCIKIYDALEETDSYESGLSELPPIELTEEPDVEFVEESGIEHIEEPNVDTNDEDEEPPSKEEG